VNSDALDAPFLLWYRFPLGYEQFIRPESGNPFIPALLLPAMRAGEPLELPAPVSPRLLRATKLIQGIYHAWDPSLYQVAIQAPIIESDGLEVTQARETALFVSLGLDSLYSLMKNVHEHPEDGETISHLIHVLGFDIRVRNEHNATLDAIRGNVHKLGDRFNKTVVCAATNLRDIMDRFVDWSLLGHGAGLASVGLSLEALFENVHIAAGPTYADPKPCGSHPILDPLWSTERQSFFYDGAEATRLEKAKFVAQFPAALETLRVCFRDPPQAYNCGRCWKCLSTMIRLDIAGALQDCPTLPQHVDVENVRRVQLEPELRPSVYKRILDEVQAADGDVELQAALGRLVDEALAREPGSLAEIYHLQTQVVHLGPLRAELARLQGLLEEQTAWALRSVGEVAVRDALIRRLQAERDEQAAWALRSAEAVAERDALIVALRDQLRATSGGAVGPGSSRPSALPSLYRRACGWLAGRLRTLNE
jgi:hypothetical protein